MKFHYLDEEKNKRNYEGIYCGKVLNDIWVSARVEMGNDRKWYLVGLSGLQLVGLGVRRE